MENLRRSRSILTRHRTIHCAQYSCFLSRLSRPSIFSSNPGCVLSCTCETKGVSKHRVASEAMRWNRAAISSFPFARRRLVPPMLTCAPLSSYAADNDLRLAVRTGRDSTVSPRQVAFIRKCYSSSTNVSLFNAAPLYRQIYHTRHYEKESGLDL